MKIVIFEIGQEEENVLNEIISAMCDTQCKIVEISPVPELSFPGLHIDLRARRVMRDDTELALTNYEYHVLCYLARHAGWVRTRQQIFEAIWHETADTGYHSVETIIYQLRHKLEANPSNPQYIHTVVGFGYKFIKASSGQL